MCVCVCEIVRNSEQAGISGHRGPDREWQKLMSWREVGRCLPGKEGLGYPYKHFYTISFGSDGF